LNALRAPLILAFSAAAWTCPACGAEQTENSCSVCGLPLPPPGMVYVPASSVVVQGDTVQVGAFFIDSLPVAYRDVLPWLGQNCRDGQVLASVITGQYSDSGHFLAFTPFVATATSEYSVPAVCLDRPAAAFTWTGAQWYLSSRGARLPTLAEIHAAAQLGLIQPFNAFNEMQLYANLLETSLGDILGALGRQAMFAGYSTEEERVMWELTHTPLGGDPSIAMPETGDPCIMIFKPLPVPIVTGTGRDTGYFNVIFRGAIDLPGHE